MRVVRGLLSRPGTVLSLAFTCGIVLLTFQNCAKVSYQSESSTQLGSASQRPIAACQTPQTDLSNSSLASYQSGTAAQAGFTEYLDSPASSLLKYPYVGSFSVGDGGRVLVSSYCGHYSTADDGASFQSLDVSRVYDAGQFSAVAASGQNIYVGTVEGIWTSNDGGASFTKTFTITDAGAAIQQIKCVSFSLSGIGVGTIDVVASGNDVFMSNLAGVYVSHDKGHTWKISKASYNGLDITFAMFGAYRINKSGSRIYVSSAYPVPNRGAISYPSLASGTCTTPPGPTNFGIYYSDDNGDTFQVLPGSPPTSQNVAVSGNTIYSFGYPTQSSLQYGWSVSKDGGQSFSALNLSAGARTYSGGAYQMTPMAIVGNKFFTVANSGRLVVSSDGGASFANVEVDSAFPGSILSVLNVAAHNNSLLVLTDRGVYVSHDGGNTFTSRYPFSSSYCSYPWGGNAGFGFPTSSGPNLYFSTYMANWASHDGGNSFRLVNGGSNATTSMAVGNGLYSHVVIAQGNSFVQTSLASTDGGANFSSVNYPITDLGSQFKISVLEPNPQSPTTSTNFYISEDGADLSAPVKSYFSGSLDTIEAYSSGSRIVAGGNGVGVAVFDNGNLVTTLATKIGVAQLGMQVLYHIDGVYYFRANTLYASYDNGTTWQEAKAPFQPGPLVSYRGRTCIVQKYGLFCSYDGGHTFPQYTEDSLCTAVGH